MVNTQLRFCRPAHTTSSALLPLLPRDLMHRSLLLLLLAAYGLDAEGSVFAGFLPKQAAQVTGGQLFQHGKPETQTRGVGSTGHRGPAVLARPAKK